MLEVKDKQNKIAFSIKYENLEKFGPGVVINGYFLGDSHIAVYNSDAAKDSIGHRFPDSLHIFNCISTSDPDWKQKAGKEISRIQSIFPK